MACALVSLLTSCASATEPSPGCLTYRDCSDGETCQAGSCLAVESVPGDTCAREADCGAGQTCSLVDIDADEDGATDSLAPRCAAAAQLLPLGNNCHDDAQCATGSCALGRCAELCSHDSDCKKGWVCSAMPKALGRLREAMFGACLPASGVVQVPLRVDPDPEERAILIPVPEHALSVTLVADSGEPWIDVAFTRVFSPSGEPLWIQPLERDQEFTQPLRVQIGPQTTGVLIPSSSAAPLEPGVYRATVNAWLGSGSSASAVPRLHALYRLGLPGRVLDVSFHFADLGEHPCLPSVMGPLVAPRAADDTLWREVLDAWGDVFAPAGILIGQVEYEDVLNRPDLDAIETHELPELFALGDERSGLHVYVVRSLQPLGVLVSIGGRPGPVQPGTARSGVVLSADALCLLAPREVGTLLARAAAGYMGLHETVSVEGVPDGLDSTGLDGDNLLYYRLGKGVDLTGEQRDILRGSPLLR
jgi:hypothetical protein